jgi:uncharacterized membrane protein YedE/YeeE
MRQIIFLLSGIIFGIIMTKSEAISWYRIHEMFRFESFHMYGIIGTAVVLGAFFMFLMRKGIIKTIDGETVTYTPMKLNITRHLLAGSIFGLGWGLVGCCPGPMYVLIGNGYFIIAVVLVGAILGTFTYGVVKDKLPH